MGMKGTAVCFVALAFLSSLCDAQWGNYQPFSPVFQRAPPPKTDTQQQKQTFEKPLTWTYPEDPKPDPPTDVPFELRHPVPAATVAVECREKNAHVEVKKDIFGIGQLINSADLTLGTCGYTAEDTAAQVLIFEAQLQDCGSTLMVGTQCKIPAKSAHTYRNSVNVFAFMPLLDDRGLLHLLLHSEL